MLIVKDEKQWERPRGVIRLDTLGEGREISVYYLRERRFIQAAFVRKCGKVVDPQNVIVPRLPDHPQQLPVELQIGDVGEPVVLGKLGARHPLEQCIELGLLVMFLREEAILQRQPYETG